MDENKPPLAKLITLPEPPDDAYVRKKDIIDTLRCIADEIESGNRDKDTLYLHWGGIILYYKTIVERTNDYEISLLHCGGSIQQLEFDGLIQAVGNATLP
jgi:hypothetical protein